MRNLKAVAVDPSSIPTPIALGRVAWGHIKNRDAVTRADWLKVGEALLELRRVAMRELKLNKPEGGPYTRRFSQLCAANGFDDVVKEYRSAAMWMVKHWAEVSDSVSPSLTHPLAIRQAFRTHSKGCEAIGDDTKIEAEHGAAMVAANDAASQEERWTCDTRALLSDKYDELSKEDFLDLVMSLLKEQRA